MEQKNVVSLEKQVELNGRSALDELLRDGAQRMLQTAIEAEVSAYVEQHRASVSENGRRLVVRKGYLPERPIQTGLGPVRIEQPRVKPCQESLLSRWPPTTPTSSLVPLTPRQKQRSIYPWDALHPPPSTTFGNFASIGVMEGRGA